MFFPKNSKIVSGGHDGPILAFNGFEIDKIQKHENVIYEGTLRPKHVFSTFLKNRKGQDGP